MRYNNYKHDIYEMNCPTNAIMARYDLLDDSKRKPFGGLDTK